MLENTIRRFQSPAVRKKWALPDGSSNSSIRPFAVLEDRPCERAVSAGKRSSAEGVGCARTGRCWRGNKRVQMASDHPNMVTKECARNVW